MRYSTRWLYPIMFAGAACGGGDTSEPELLGASFTLEDPRVSVTDTLADVSAEISGQNVDYSCTVDGDAAASGSFGEAVGTDTVGPVGFSILPAAYVVRIACNALARPRLGAGATSTDGRRRSPPMSPPRSHCRATAREPSSGIPCP